MELPDYLVDSLHRAAVAVDQAHDLREERARAAWRQYACAAMVVVQACAEHDRVAFETVEVQAQAAALLADAMLAAEKVRFSEESPL